MKKLLSLSVAFLLSMAFATTASAKSLENDSQVARLDSMVMDPYISDGTIYSNIKYKKEYVYDANGNELSVTTYYWDKTTNELQVSSKRTEYTYDAQGNKLSTTSYSWDQTTNAWMGNSKYEYTYDAQGNKLSYMYYSWDQTTNAWVEDTKLEYTYDAMGTLLTETLYNWDSENSDWIYGSHIGYYYTYFDTAIPQIISEPSAKATKVLRDGQILILHGDKTYNLMGGRMK